MPNSCCPGCLIRTEHCASLATKCSAAHLVRELYLNLELLHLIFHKNDSAMLQASTCIAATGYQGTFTPELHESER